MGGIAIDVEGLGFADGMGEGFGSRDAGVLGAQDMIRATHSRENRKQAHFDIRVDSTKNDDRGLG